jgi:hypothetical protein
MPTRWRIPRERIYSERPRSSRRFYRIRVAADRNARCRPQRREVYAGHLGRFRNRTTRIETVREDPARAA